MLILLPHCLQNHDCAVRITGDVQNCKLCGKCKIKNLATLSEKYHVHVAVAHRWYPGPKNCGGKRPKIIIAVACERDLTSGIQDAYPIPVFGVFNRRPFGPLFRHGCRYRSRGKRVENLFAELTPDVQNPCLKIPRQQRRFTGSG